MAELMDFYWSGVQLWCNWLPCPTRESTRPVLVRKYSAVNGRCEQETKRALKKELTAAKESQTACETRGWITRAPLA